MPITKTTIANLTSYCIIPDKPDSVVILLHGYGANGQDLISLAEEWKRECPNTIFISPNAPTVCEAGGLGFQWFSLSNYSRDAMTTLIRNSWNTVSHFIDEVLKKYNLDDNRLIISGFSQGCMLALHTGFSRKNPCAGILGYSGMLLDQDLVLHTLHTKTPVQLIHGTDDMVIPVQAWEEAMKLLKDKGINVTGHKTEGLPHGIDMHGIESGLTFIKAAFNK